MRELPQSFVRRGLELAEGSSLFGKPFVEMTRDELIAAAAQGWSAERKCREAAMASSADRAAGWVKRAKSL